MSRICTPAPWTTFADVLVDGKLYFAVGIMNTTKVIALTGLMGAPDEDESIANAFLISAAPDMLEALKHFVSGPINKQTYEAARAAIAKATGAAA